MENECTSSMTRSGATACLERRTRGGDLPLARRGDAAGPDHAQGLDSCAKLNDANYVANTARDGIRRVRSRHKASFARTQRARKSRMILWVISGAASG